MQPRFVTDSTLRYVYSVCVSNIAQICCLTIVPTKWLLSQVFCFPLGWGRQFSTPTTRSVSIHYVLYCHSNNTFCTMWSKLGSCRHAIPHAIKDVKRNKTKCLYTRPAVFIDSAGICTRPIIWHNFLLTWPLTTSGFRYSNNIQAGWRAFTYRKFGQVG